MPDPVRSARRLRDDAAEATRFIQEIRDTADLLLQDHADRGDLKLLARSLRELRDALAMLASLRQQHKVTIFGSARIPASDPVYQMAVEFGKAIDAGYLLPGPGIMEAPTSGPADRSIGFNILLPFEQGAQQGRGRRETLQLPVLLHAQTFVRQGNR